ncbi:hypothetical protein [Peribacillus asahii]|uniref:hypothetical protein n=1 Tax=Peribacillus asahii TaxID=228899 RepID=UPI00381522A3
MVSEEGSYVLTVTDGAGNTKTVRFVIDKSKPTIIGVTDGQTYNSSVTPSSGDSGIVTSALTKNGSEVAGYILGTVVSEEGSYELTVTDKAGNKTKVNFAIDTTKPKLTSASIKSDNQNPKLAKNGDTVTLLIHADEDVEISETKGRIGGTIVKSLIVNNAGDGDDSTWAVSFKVSEQDPVEGTADIEFIMTDAAGNQMTVNFGSITDNSTVEVDNKPAVITSGVIESTNQYVDVTFSEPVYGGSAEALSALETTDLAAVMTKIGGGFNSVTVSIDNVTKTDGTPLVGGESVVRVHLSFAGTLVQGDKVEIKAANNAIFDHVGNTTASTEATGMQTLAPLVTYVWNEVENTITFTKGLSISPYSNTKVQLMGNKYSPDYFLTTPTSIGGDVKLKISVTAGWDNEAVFGASANGIYAQATASNTIQFFADTKCSSGDSGCFMTTDYRQDHLFVIIEHLTDPTIKTILDLNIDSRRKENAIINNE